MLIFFISLCILMYIISLPSNVVPHRNKIPAPRENYPIPDPTHFLDWTVSSIKAYLMIEGAIYSCFYTKLRFEVLNLVGRADILLHGYIPWKYKFQSQNLLHKCYLFQNILHFSLQTLLFDGQSMAIKM